MARPKFSHTHIICDSLGSLACSSINALFVTRNNNCFRQLRTLQSSIKFRYPDSRDFEFRVTSQCSVQGIFERSNSQFPNGTIRFLFKYCDIIDDRIIIICYIINFFLNFFHKSSVIFRSRTFYASPLLRCTPESVLFGTVFSIKIYQQLTNSILAFIQILWFLQLFLNIT